MGLTRMEQDFDGCSIQGISNANPMQEQLETHVILALATTVLASTQLMCLGMNLELRSQTSFCSKGPSHSGQCPAKFEVFKTYD